MKRLQAAVRVIAGAVLIYFIYQQAGVATSIFAFLMLAYTEAQTAWMTETTKLVVLLEKDVSARYK